MGLFFYVIWRYTSEEDVCYNSLTTNNPMHLTKFKYKRIPLYQHRSFKYGRFRFDLLRLSQSVYFYRLFPIEKCRKKSPWTAFFNNFFLGSPVNLHLRHHRHPTFATPNPRLPTSNPRPLTRDPQTPSPQPPSPPPRAGRLRLRLPRGRRLRFLPSKQI